MADVNGARGGADVGASKEAVYRHLAKHYQDFGEEPPELKDLAVIPFTPLEEIEKALARRINAIDLGALAEKAIHETLQRAKGRV
jgi:hypothetical protein